jgi:hypothetical protein
LRYQGGKIQFDRQVGMNRCQLLAGPYQLGIVPVAQFLVFGMLKTDN